MELDKRGYVPGEPISGKITIENKSKESVKCAFLRIIQTSTCYSRRPEIDVKVTTFEAAGEVSKELHDDIPHFFQELGCPYQKLFPIPPIPMTSIITFPRWFQILILMRA